MPRHTAKPPEPAISTQPALFEPEQMPSQAQLLEGAKSYVHTGRTTCKDEERAEALVTAYIESHSLLSVARRFHVSPNTVKAVLEVFEAAGKLDDLKQRVARKLGTVAELCADASIEMLLAGKVPANVLPIMEGVAIEKKALLEGEATSRIEAAVLAPVDLEAVRAYLQTRSIDVQSSVVPQKPKETT